ncbi:hypothetical protein [Streptomyces iconiensis]|uniref:Uncharacterized protein n=1 Tax=Streptomyces iconiensis TaxID=1384038 RepID=A0ABT7AB11_9ACTN|nr:hypothetical protein [Streptomyces iconiensis]MDJ1138542.1 hypothetical protein [Streptomyces iconiensis]
MSDIEKASKDAVEAARQGEQFAMLLAAVQAAQQTQPAPCQHPPPPQQGAVGKWVAIGIAGTFLAVGLAVSMVAFAVGAVALTTCVVVLRTVFTDFTREGRP